MPGVDGLRALAVLAVFVYHFHNGGGWLPGGFLGVDVFFVISGYLITSLLLSEFRRDGPHRPRAASGCAARGGCCPAVGVLIAVVMVLVAIFDFGRDRHPARRRARLAGLRRQLVPDPRATSPTSSSSRGPRCSATSGRWRSRSSSTCSGRSSSRPGMTLLRPPAAARRACIAGAIASALLMAILFDPATTRRASTTAPTRGPSALLVGVALAFVWHPASRLRPGTANPGAAPLLDVDRRRRGCRLVLVTFLTVHDYDRASTTAASCCSRSGPRC